MRVEGVDVQLRGLRELVQALVAVRHRREGPTGIRDALGVGEMLGVGQGHLA